MKCVQQWFVPSSGPLSWLDGSHITYSRWVSSPLPGAACGHILRDSGFQWDATSDCNKNLPFICQFGMYLKNSIVNHALMSYHFVLLLYTSESGRSIVCAGRSTTLQCGSGQVLIIDGGFYGRKSVHYCRSMHSPPTTPTQRHCSWVDVVESLTGIT